MSKREEPSSWFELTFHAAQRMDERGASLSEVEETIREGARERAERGRWLYRKRFEFEGTWRGREYHGKEVAVVVVEEESRLVVVTVYVFYLGRGGGS